MDWMDQEQERGITITSAATTCFWNATTASTSSTPRATSTSPSRSSARCACSTARWRCSTPSPASSRSPRRCGARPTSTACRASRSSTRWTASAPTSTAACAMMRERLDATPVPIQLPLGARGQLPRRHRPRRDEGAIVYNDETLGAEYELDRDPRGAQGRRAQGARADGRGVCRGRRRSCSRSTSRARPITNDELRAALRRGHDRRSSLSRCSAARLQEQGRAAAARRGGRLPAVAARHAAGRRASTPTAKRRCVREPHDDEPFAALVFKIMTDPFVGQLAFFRVYSGTLESGDSVLNAAQAAAASASAACSDARQQARGDHRGARPATSPPRSACKNVTTGDTLCDPKQPIAARVDDFPEPVISVAHRAQDQGRPGEARHRARQADARGPDASASHTDEETGQTIIAGMGELHLEIIVDRLMREFNVDANVGKPQVAYRETITRRGRGRGPLRPADRRPRPVRPRARSVARPTRGRRLRLREQDRRRRDPARSSSRRSRRASARRSRRGPLAGYPMQRHQGRPHRRQLPRGRLVRDGVQDRRLDGVPGRAARRPSRCSSSR